MHVPQGRWLAVNATPERQIWRGDLRAAVTRSDQRTLGTRECFNDRLNGVEGRTQGTLEVVPPGQEPRGVVTH